MRQFYLGRNSSGYYRVYFVDPVTGNRDSGKSTHTKDKVEATMIATSWLQNGQPDGRSNSRAFSNPKSLIPVNYKHLVENLSREDAHMIFSLLSDKFGFSTAPSQPSQSSQTTQTTQSNNQPNNPSKPKSKNEEGIKLADYLLNFWDFEKSEFIKRYLAKGKRMSRKHADNMKSLAKNYWLPYFGEDKLIQDLDEEELEDFFFYLFSERKLKGATVNKAINCGSRAIRYLFDKHKISVNPMAGIERYGTDELKRGIPTESEVKALLNLEWGNAVGKLAFELAAYCGMRAGEISGLRVCDIDLKAEILHIRHSWSEMDGLKSTKNTEERDVPIDRSIALRLMNHARCNPNYSDLSYVFFSNVKPEQPYWPSYYQDSFYEAMAEIGISEEQRRERNIVFHSLRHFSATILAQRADIKTVQAILGHKTEKMSMHYSDHDTIEKLNNMKIIMQDAWNNYISA